MTSPHFSERTTRTERTDFSPKRKNVPTVRRGLKKRGVLPSFGDMILPIVGVFAVVLLVIFGRQFFLNGLKSSPGISSTRAYAEAPAILAELERSRLEAEAAASAEVPDPVAAVSEDLVAKSKDKEEKEDFFALAVAVQQDKKPEVKQVKQAPAQKKQTQAQTQKQNNSGLSSVSDKQWRVQVGAYTTKAGAQDAANKIRKSGYSATVYSNPASKHFKVWVAGGKDKKAADNVVKAMQKIGFKGSFPFPPAK